MAEYLSRSYGGFVNEIQLFNMSGEGSDKARRVFGRLREMDAWRVSDMVE